MNEIEIYKTRDGKTEVEVRIDGETVWLSLDQMAGLFDRDKSVISRHLSNIFKAKELVRKAVVAKNATTARDGKIYQVEYFNLDAIISVGYRVNSKRGAQFRQWATQRLREHLVQGYTVNRQRLDQLQKTIQSKASRAQRRQVHKHGRRIPCCARAESKVETCPLVPEPVEGTTPTRNSGAHCLNSDSPDFWITGISVCHRSYA